MFLAALSYVYFAKALSGSYMKRAITQLERRFDISSYLIGIIDGSFEIGTFPMSSCVAPHPHVLRYLEGRLCKTRTFPILTL